jgi:Lhr-like helicase
MSFVAVHLKDLHLILKNNPITVKIDNEHLINFQRFVKFMDRAKELLLHRAPNYLEMFRHDGRLEYLEGQLRSMEVLKRTEDEVKARSLFLERRENVEQKGRSYQMRSLGFLN